MLDLTRAGSGASTIGSCHVVPVNQDAGPLRVGSAPHLRISMTISFTNACRQAIYRKSFQPSIRRRALARS
jgi:hypothetical protein